MKIIKCPACKQCVHFDYASGVMSCWSCGVTSDFSCIKNGAEKFTAGFNRAVNSLVFPNFSSLTFLRVGKIGMVLFLPLAIAMLLICNSFDISVVHDPAASFASHRIPSEEPEDNNQVIINF